MCNLHCTNIGQNSSKLDGKNRELTPSWSCSISAVGSHIWGVLSWQEASLWPLDDSPKSTSSLSCSPLSTSCLPVVDVLYIFGAEAPCQCQYISENFHSNEPGGHHQNRQRYPKFCSCYSVCLFSASLTCVRKGSTEDDHQPVTYFNYGLLSVL